MADNAKNKNIRPGSEDYLNTKVFLNSSLDKLKEISQEVKNILEEIEQSGQTEWFKLSSADIRHRAWQLNDNLFDIRRKVEYLKTYIKNCKN